MKKELASETLERISKIRLRPERKEALRAACMEHQALALVIQYAYHPGVEFDLPEGDVPESQLKGSSMHGDYGVFYRQIKKLKNFFTSSPVKRLQKETNFIGLCADVDARDMKLLIGIKDKKLPWRSLGKTFCVTALPELFPPEMVEEIEANWKHNKDDKDEE